MEHQPWAVQNQLTFQEFAIGNILLKLKAMVIVESVVLGLCILALRLYLWPIEQLLGLIAGMVVVIVLVAPIGLWFIYRAQKKLGHVATEISSEGFRITAENIKFKSFIEWSVVKKISHKFNLIFVECDVGAKSTILIPFRIFKDQAEGERFYADLNHFWEQGR